MAQASFHPLDQDLQRLRRRGRTTRRHRRRSKNRTEESREEDAGINDLALQLQDSHYLSQAARRAQVKVFVEHTLSTGVVGLIAEFKAMKRGNDFSRMREFVAQIPQGRNRYKDVGCLDFQRVMLHLGPVSYIHANYVSTPVNSKRFICTQAPLPNTCADFWYMVVQEKSIAIIMLCNFVEQGSRKSADYVPLSFDNKTYNFDGVIVTLKKQEYFQFPIETRVHIRVSFLEVRVPGLSPHYCIHYHWQDWPDRGVPDADLASIYLLTKIQTTTAPIIIHCSAGVGRTGSIVLLQNSLELLQSQQPLRDIASDLLALRKQRNNSVQTQHQYLYVHQVLLNYLQKMKYLDDSINPYLEKFTADYEAATKGF
ncbi:unnamed protein product [Cylicocyclus nassatus]|uniref:Protein-tyrosine phosphatase n=1 Tax=Cylicocyclus nassatus TaxID=53992 RepID=A0AA36DM08_CYLNA|nr:unnamed protein product [Cylicocyclus nassatus]